VTQETGAIKAQSGSGVVPPLSICNAEGARFLGSQAPCASYALVLLDGRATGVP
jgi:hypothetical protein